MNTPLHLRQRLCAAFALPVLTLAPGAAYAGNFADLAAIDRAVAQFIGVDQAQAAGFAEPVDRRLHLAQCGAPLALDWHGSNGRNLRVRCPQAGGWTIYVPIRGGTTQAEAQPVIARGDGVTVTLAGQGFSVSRAAEAMEPGRMGEWIRVRPAKGQILRAKVLRPGGVGIELP